MEELPNLIRTTNGNRVNWTFTIPKRLLKSRLEYVVGDYLKMVFSDDIIKKKVSE